MFTIKAMVNHNLNILVIVLRMILMNNIAIYKEKNFSKENIIIFGIIIIIVVIICIAVIQQYGANFFLIIIFLFNLFFLFGIMINFRQLNIILTTEYIVVNYGLLKQQFMWNDINDCYLDDASAIVYGGFGLRVASYKGKTRLVYNTVKSPRIVLSIKDGSFEEFVFSTKNPEEIIKIIEQKIKNN